MNKRQMALTTGQAANCCFVTPDTIVNWIKSGLLPAQRTAGGQFRILSRDLRTFMKSKGMSTEVLDEDNRSHRPMCWQFHSNRKAGSRKTALCEGCLVKFLGVVNCFKLMGMRPQEGGQYRDCLECGYFKKWGDEPTSKVGNWE